MLKRALNPVCKCGQLIQIPKGRTKARCPIDGCGMRWELKPDGYWAIGLNTILFTPIVTSPSMAGITCPFIDS